MGTKFHDFSEGFPIVLEISAIFAVFHVCQATSLLFQLTVAVFKKILKKQVWEFGKHSQQNLNQDSSESVVKQLRDIVLAGFSNVYSIYSILLFTFTFSIWQGFKLTEGPEKVNELKEESSTLKGDEEEISTPRENPRLPSTIIVFAILLFAFNLLQFYRNNALRFLFKIF